MSLITVSMAIMTIFTVEVAQLYPYVGDFIAS
jgi:hypothetical protein